MLVLAPLMALAQVVLPESTDGQVDYGQLIGALIANPKAFTAAIVGALVIFLIVQALKAPALGRFFKFLDPKIQFAIITVLGQAYGVVVHAFVLKDQGISAALVGVFSAGGAAAIFNAIRLIFVKPKPAAIANSTVLK